MQYVVATGPINHALGPANQALGPANQALGPTNQALGPANKALELPIGPLPCFLSRNNSRSSVIWSAVPSAPLEFL